jgi:hypothetical protein
MRTILLLLLLTLLPFDSGYAAALDLYTGEAVVADQGAAERRRALPLALAHVLRKLSGLRNFDEYPVVEPALGRASSIVVSFHYRNVPTLLSDGSETEGPRLVARFSPQEVDRLARSLQLPLWRPERLPLVTWLVIDDGLDRRILPLEFAYIQKSMEQVAQQRGLALVWPQADEEGNYPVDLQLLWGGYTEELSDLDDDGVMILAARREGTVWSVRANLTYGDLNWAWRLQDIDLQSVLNESMEQAVDEIAAANTIAAEDLGVWEHELTITGLLGSHDYQRCLNYLQDISTVEHVTVIAARPTAVTFRLQLNALPLYLEETLSNGDMLEPASTGDEYVLLRGGGNDR